VVELGHGSGGGISFRAAPVRNTLQHTATHCNTLQHTATHCNTLQHTATHCNTLHRAASRCNSSEAASPSSLLRSATRYSTLQLTTTRCITLLLIGGGISLGTPRDTTPVSWHVCPDSPSIHILFCINIYVYRALLRIYTESFTHILEAASLSAPPRSLGMCHMTHSHVSHV